MPILVNGKQATPKIGDKRVIRVLDGKDGSIKYHIPYIKDGLVLHLDGINNTGSGHSNTTTMWKNLAGDDDVKLIVKSLDWDDSSVGFDNTSTPTDWGRWIYYPSNYVTIEVVAVSAIVGTSIQQLVGNVQSGGASVFINGTTNESLAQAYIGASYATPVAPISLEPFSPIKRSMTYDGLEVTLYDEYGQVASSVSRSGVIKAPANNTVYAISSNPSGQIATSESFTGRIYAARVYTRALSADEIAHNAFVDFSRFGVLSDTAL